MQLIELFDAADVDRNGSLSAAEVCSFVATNATVFWSMGAKGKHMSAHLEAHPEEEYNMEQASPG